MLNKREWRRVAVNLSAQIRPLVTGKDIPVKIMDINNQGLCFATPSAFAPGEKLDITISVKEYPGLKVRGQVVWSGFFVKEDSYRTGVRLIDEDPAVCKLFLQFYNYFLIRSTPDEVR